MPEQNSYRLDKSKLYWTIGIAVVAILIVTAMIRTRKREIKDIKVEIKHLADGVNDFIKEKDIKEILRRSFDENVAELRVGQVDVNRVETVLEQDPFIENAETYVDIGGDLNIKITQRNPICRIIDQNGLNYYLDKNGVRMPLSRYFSARVPVVTGAVPPHIPDFLAKKKHGLKDVYILLDYLEKDNFYKTFIQQIHIDPSGEFTLIPILGDQKLRIGTIDDLAEKMKRLKIFYEEAIPYEGWKKYNSISVKYKGQIVCKKR